MAAQNMFFSGVLEELNGRMNLVGSKCECCGKISFPAAELCMFCGEDSHKKVTLSETGKLYSYSVTKVPVGPFTPPIITGFVDLKEGVRIFGQIHAGEAEIKEGMEMSIRYGTLYIDREGTDVTGYWFVPVNGGKEK